MTALTEHGATLRVTLPGVVSWSRPRRDRGGVRYPRAYVRNRDAWAIVVAHAVRCQQWRPPPTARYRVVVTVYGGGRRDLDRECTAVLDALQAGAAVHDDCLVDALAAARFPLRRGGRPNTLVEVAPRSGNGAPRCPTKKPPLAPEEARQVQKCRAR